MGISMRDKIHAGWMGKNIGGTLGGPLEGRMEILEVKGYTQTFVGPEANDDLDLQLVNLHSIEQYGGHITTKILSNEWLSHVHFEYDEYGHSLTNMRRGIMSPLSGYYNNFFRDCMGSPIRSEIWAMACAGRPDQAAYYAYQDASVDHAGGEGVYGEVFFAVLECLALASTGEPIKLISDALSYIPDHCSVRKAVELLLSDYEKGFEWKETRADILRHFGRPNFTYAPVNIAFTLIGLLYEKDFSSQMLLTLNCGYDTDCTAATLGSLLGMLYGPEYMPHVWTKPLGEAIVVSKSVYGFRAPKTINELTERTLAAQQTMLMHYQMYGTDAFVIKKCTDCEIITLPEESVSEPDTIIRINRDSKTPALAPGEETDLTLSVTNVRTTRFCCDVDLILPDEFSCISEPTQTKRRTINSGETIDIIYTIKAPCKKSPVWHARIVLTERTESGIIWSVKSIPFVYVPTMDFIVGTCSDTHAVHLRENRIAASDIGEHSGKIQFWTKLSIPQKKKYMLRLICKHPVHAWIDGEMVISCDDETLVIPAYHRADARKGAELEFSEGTHALKIEIDAPNGFDELYFYLVDHEFWFAHENEALFCI